MGESVRARAALLLGLALAACAPATAPPPTNAPAGASADVAALAEILALEDARAATAADLARFVGAPAASTRARGALALGRVAPPGAAAVLVPLLSDQDTAVAATAAFALGEVADSSAIEALAYALASPSPARATVAAEAAYALGKIPSERAQRTVLDFLASASAIPAEPVRSALLAAWRFRRPPDPAPVLRWAAHADPEIRWRAAYALARRPDRRAAPALLDLARDPDPAVRASALRGLTPLLLDSAGVAHADAIALLGPAMRDADYATRLNAARSLGAFRDPDAVAALGAALSAPDRHLALVAMESLARIGAPAARWGADLVAAAVTASTPVFLRQTALESAVAVDSARAALAAAHLAGDDSWRIRSSAARVLARERGAPSAALRGLVDDADSRVATAALQAIVDAAGDSLAPVRSLLVEQLRARDPYVRGVALSALARLRDPATLPALLDAYALAASDSVNDAALAALDAIAALRTETLLPERAFFARFPRSPDFLVRRKAYEHFGPAALAAWGPAVPVETGKGAGEYADLLSGERSAREPELLIRTEAGEVRVRLFRREAPLTAESFLALARRGYFDRQEWPRVVPNFVVQGGDPRGDTSGGPGYAIRDEMNRHPYLSGTLGMALSGPDTGGSQFFLTHSPQPHLDGGYTVFGEVVQGQSVLERILPGDLIHSVTIVQ